MEDSVKDIAKSVPAEAWLKLVNTASDTFISLVSPATTITTGISVLIEHKFQSLLDVRKVYAAECLKQAQEKIDRATAKPKINVTVKPSVFYEVFESTEQQVDGCMMDLWSNVVAREILEGSVHPEILRIFRKLTLPDIQVLLTISDRESSLLMAVVKALGNPLDIPDVKNFSQAYLLKLGLVTNASSQWFCTVTGKELIRSISLIEGVSVTK